MKNRIIKNYIKITLISLFGLMLSCKKDFLEAVPNKRLFIPETIAQLQALLDNFDVINDSGHPGWLDLQDDDYFVREDLWLNSLQIESNNAYIWKSEIYNGSRGSDDSWYRPYRNILYANTALQGIEKIDVTPMNHADWNNLKGSAYFIRAFTYYGLTQTFAPPYSENSANVDLGVPIRLVPSLEEKSVRPSVQQNYELMLNDLHQAVDLLPIKALVKTRPSRAAANALLARIYLLMDDFENAYKYADLSLKDQNTLLNYNNILPATYPMLRLNDEVVFHSRLLNSTFTSYPYKQIIPELFSSYNDNDLRKTVWFRKQANGEFRYYGSYNQAIHLFGGITTAEMYLVRAETSARLGNTQAALNDLNTLLESRYKTGTFIPLTASGAEEALRIVLRERRKELVFRGLRWSDLRRLNKDPRFAKTLTRVIAGETYTLPPNDPRYTFPIPLSVIEFTGMQQNQR